MSSFSGADVEQLRALATRIERQSSKLREIASSSTAALMVAAWTGANIDQLRAEWKLSSKPQLLAAAADFAHIALQLRRQADEQAAASAATSGSLRTSLRLPDQTDGKVTVTERANPPDLGSPCSLGGIIKQVNQQYEPESGSGQVGIRTTVAADGTKTHIVLIPGTQDWFNTDGNPFNAHASVAAGQGNQTDVARLVKEAMRQAGIGEDEEVMLIGHSLGGLEAGNLAADAEFRRQYNISSVVAYGADISSRDIPSDVSVLQFKTSRNEGVGDITRFAGWFSGRGEPLRSQANFREIVLDHTSATPINAFLDHGSDLYAAFADGWGSDFGRQSDRDHWDQENAGFLCAPDATTSYRAFAGVQVG